MSISFRIIVTAVTLAAAVPSQAGEDIESTLKALLENKATAPAEGQIHEFSDFKMGRIAGIGLGDTMNKVVKRWGSAADMRSSHGGLTWTHYYENAVLLYRDYRLIRITVGRNAPFDWRFSNNISGSLTRDEVITALGPPKRKTHAGLYYAFDEKRVSFTFKLEGAFPENSDEWVKATFATISVE